jgi:hypothetical protein
MRCALPVGARVILMRAADTQQGPVGHVTACDRRRRVIAISVDFHYAREVAEDRAHQQQTARFVNRSASWRREPVNGQLEALRRWRVAVRHGLTKGEAFDLLATAAGRVA